MDHPHNDEAERSVLAAILNDQDGTLTDKAIADGLKPESFFEWQKGMILSAVIRLRSKDIIPSVVTLAQDLSGTAELDKVGGATALVSLVNENYSLSQFPSHLELVLCLACQRQAMAQSEAVKAVLNNDYMSRDELRAAIIKPLGSIENIIQAQAKVRTVDDMIRDVAKKAKSYADGTSDGRDLIYTGIPEFDRWAEPLERHEFCIIAARPGRGKAQPHYSKILTPSGWSTMGEIKPGDYAIGANGKPQKVIAKHPQGVKKIVRVTFKGGESVDCCEDHLWKVSTRITRKNDRPQVVMSCKDMINHGLKSMIGGARQEFSVCHVDPIEFDAKADRLPIAPYLLGVILGDGCLSSSSVIVCNPERDIMRRCSMLLPHGDIIVERDTKKHCLTWAIRKTKRSSMSKNKTCESLCSLGLQGTDSFTKFIPNNYLTASIDDRIALLRGLIDTDGHCDTGMRFEFSTVSDAIKDGVVWLVRSLGGVCRVDQRTTTFSYKGEKRLGAPSWRVWIYFYNGIRPFSSDKHSARYSPEGNRSSGHYIKGIEYIGEMECSCITVDGGLYVTDDFIVTHNSSLARQIAWHNIKMGKNVLAFLLETSDCSFIEGAAAIESGIGIKQLKGSLPNHQEKFYNALSTVRSFKNNFRVYDKDNTMDAITTRCRVARAAMPIGLVVIDYIQICRGRNPKLSTADAIGEITGSMLSLVKLLGCPVIAMSQLSRDQEKASNRQPVLSDLRDSGSLEADASRVVFIHKPTKDRNGIDQLDDVFRTTYHCELFQAKHREGPIYNIKVDFHAPTTTFRDKQ